MKNAKVSKELEGFTTRWIDRFLHNAGAVDRSWKAIVNAETNVLSCSSMERRLRCLFPVGNAAQLQAFGSDPPNSWQ
ncbi:MAG: hypothetical protein QF744_14390 [SAR202 cluster bacterium]|nr:hypothetical protein [SAR202 cluster bacterium]